MSNIKAEKNERVELNAVARFLTEKIDAISPRKTQRQVAFECGYDKPNVLSMMKRGDAKVPLEKVPLLARALEVDPGHLMRLSLEQYWPGMDDIIRDIFGNTVSHNEMALIRQVRSSTRGFDPELSENQLTAIGKITARPLGDGQLSNLTKALTDAN